MIRGDICIYETVAHEGILFIAQNAMLESALALSSKYNASFPDLHYHIRDLLLRFSNRALGDTCARVGADTKRKLGNNDRLIGAFLCCGEQGVSPAFISIGIAAAVLCHLKENGAPQSREAARAVLEEVAGVREDSVWIEMILSFHVMLASIGQGKNFDEVIKTVIKAASAAGYKPDII